ncbi:segregation and condensation protein B [Sporosarcina luteola]|nr:segregation and condensation protein B [Sporosarcina luteola]
MTIDSAMLGRIESLLFVAGDDGLAPDQIATIIDTTKGEAERLLDQLQTNYEGRMDAGITMRKYGGRYRLVTKGEYASDIAKMLENPSPKLMTQASMEVLAIIAYKQPVTRVEIDDLRGVKSEGPLQTLVAKGLVMEKGRLEGSGRPILYGTTELFLDRFGLESLDGLPPLAEVEEGEQEDTDLFMTKFQEAFNMEEDEGGIMD